MAQTPDQGDPSGIGEAARPSEPTLTDVIERLDRLSTDVDRLSTDVERSTDRFSSYQQATQWVVQLAFTLIASATITVIVTAVLRR